MDITQQQYMIALAETGSITKAAERLGVSQPAISNWLKGIEKQLGTQLVIRSKRGLTLTPAGDIYLEASRRMVETKERIYHEISRFAGGCTEVVTIAGTPNGGADLFARIYHHLSSELPSLELRFIEGYNRSSIDMVRRGTADIALGTLAGDLSACGDDIEYIETARQELILAVPLGYPTAYDASGVRSTDPLPRADMSKLAGLPFIMPDEEISYHDALISWFLKTGYVPNAVFQSASTRSIYNMVKNGNGIGIMQRRFFSPLDRIAPFSLDPPIRVFSAILYKRDRSMSPEFQSLLDKLSRLLSR